MKFTWRYSYVPEGQLEQDEHGRWQVIGSIEVEVRKCFPEYIEQIDKGYMPEWFAVPVAYIEQKGSGSVPSTIHRFCASIPCTKWNPLDLGFGEANFFSNDIEDLKRQVEEQYIRTRNMFLNCRE